MTCNASGPDEEALGAAKHCNFTPSVADAESPYLSAAIRIVDKDGIPAIPGDLLAAAFRRPLPGDDWGLHVNPVFKIGPVGLGSHNGRQHFPDASVA
ncbi:hypothetical protein DITRI_Ditri16bG0043300 [Diplodiscus trichospermus]